MEKEKFIIRINLKDYNNQLEKILSQKNFSEDTKNLLLSMLYKVETAYKDYSKVGIDIKPKKELLEELLEIISKDCKTIEIVREKQTKVNEKEGKITTYLNALPMLYAIYKIDSRKFKVLSDYEIIKPSLEIALNQGYAISSSEIIRNFDGWSWNNVSGEIENFLSNLIYQILKILVGEKFLTEWKTNSKEDHIQALIAKLRNNYKVKLADDLFKAINQLSILNNIENDKEERQRLINVQSILQKEFDELDNKKEYINKMQMEKQSLMKKIKQITDIIEDDRKLKDEFIIRNEKLSIEERIFSISDLVDILEEEKTNLMRAMNTYNKKMDLLNFDKTKEEVQNRLTLLKELKLEEQTDIKNIKIKELLKLTMEAVKTQIEMTEEREKIIKLLYTIRYFSLIYINEKQQFKDIIDINKLQRFAVTKACKQRIITIFSQDIKENYEIIKSILQTNIIDLEKMYFKFIQAEGKILLEIYDENTLYSVVEFSELKDLNVKKNKKIKVFI